MSWNTQWAYLLKIIRSISNVIQDENDFTINHVIIQAIRRRLQNA